MIRYLTIPAVLLVLAGCTPEEILTNCQTLHPDRQYLFNFPEVGATVESAVYDTDMTLTVTKSPARVANDCSMVTVQVSAMNPIGQEMSWAVDARFLTSVSE